jgi:quercetin dioxygenase-like cupin family protein
MRRLRPILAVVAIGVLGAVAVAHVIAQSTAAPAVQRQALAQSTRVNGVKGRTLGLSRVVIPAGGTIALHHHEGTQIAFIQSGVLTYTVRDGAVTVMSGPADDPQVVRKIKAGQTGKISGGQWIVEQPSTIHQATNQGNAKIVIYLSTLLKTGAPPSTPNG